MADNIIQLKLTIDNKEAIASLKLTDDNIRELYKSFKYGKQELNGLITSISQGFNNAREIIQGFKEAFDVISTAFSTHLSSYQEQEDALIKLNTALQQTGQYTESNVKALTDYASKLQEATIYGDEVTESVMAQLLAMGLTVEQTKQATLQAANLATVMGTDLNTAARAMADLFNGNTGLIGRYVKGLDETIIKSGDLDKIMAMLNERIGGQAEAMGRTNTGAIARMNNAIGDLKENTGALLSTALEPFVSIISRIVKDLNELSPTMSGVIGLIASMTTAFITLRVTGLLPAIESIKLFGVALTGLKAAMVKSGVGALIIGLSYGFYELTKAIDNYLVRKSGLEAALSSAGNIRQEISKATKKELEWTIKDATEQISLLQSELNHLRSEYEKSLHYRKDKEGFEYPVEGEKSRLIKQQIEFIKTRIKFEQERIDIANEYLNKSNEIKKSKNKEELQKEFEHKAELLRIEHTHQENMLEIETDNELLLLKMKIEHFNKLIELYKQYNQDVTELIYRRVETEIMLNKKLQEKQYEIEIEKSYEPEDILLKDIGDVNEYSMKTKEMELEIWYQKEKEKIKNYENSNEMLAALDKEYLRKKREIMLEENMLYTSLTDGFSSAAQAIASAGSSAIQVFRQANSVLQIFINSLVQAFIQSLALKAAMSAFNFVSAGFGKVITGALGVEAVPAAEGAIVTKPTLMLVGEGKHPEGVFPLPYLNSINQPVNVNLKITLNGSTEIDGFKLRQLIKTVERELSIKR